MKSEGAASIKECDSTANTASGVRLKRRGKADQTKSISELVEENLETASKLATRFFRKRLGLGIERSEFESAAHLGLVEAAIKYRPTGGSSFKTFSYFRIHGAMSDLLRRGGPMSFSQFREFRKLRSAFPEATRTSVLGLDDKEVIKLPTQASTIEDTLILKERFQRVREAVAKLTPLEQALVRLRYVEGKSTQAFSYNGDCYSKTRVFRLHAEILRKLRVMLNASEGASA